MIEAVFAVGPRERFSIGGGDVLRIFLKQLSTPTLLMFLLAASAVLIGSSLLEENEGGHGSRRVDKLLGIHI